MMNNETRILYCIPCEKNMTCMQNDRTKHWYCKKCFATIGERTRSQRDAREPLP